MLTVTENTTQQINAALFEQDQNVKNKLSTVSGVVSAVYGACEWIFNKLKESLARVATTGSYNDLTDKPTIVDTVAQNVPNAVSSNAVYGALTNKLDYETITVTGTSTAGTCTLSAKRNSLTTVIKGSFTFSSNINKGIGVTITLNQSLFPLNSNYRSLTVYGTNFFILWNGGQNTINIRPMLENVTSGSVIEFQIHIDRVVV